MLDREIMVQYNEIRTQINHFIYKNNIEKDIL
nr:MAG TPA: hypothetical protein [Caudoviricetes sp.]